MNLILDLLLSAGVLLLLAYIMPQVTVKSFWTALWVAILVGILNVLIGYILTFILNLVTFFLLEFLVKLIVSAIVIKIADKLVRNFEIKGFWPALVIALALSLVSTFVNRSDEEDRAEYSALPITTPTQVS
ncbi:phage holin family protein [Rufibacter immobilis]|uniref:Phage holin family protein n=1 Tax=Rufibacter immobilis TaxID=1348778 RepID=A0A3M9MQD3_9BACT|nr:phage holin family protein [Rufibacter immobilis]RNI27720.1 phage holin family protein [Rufibacter immobilis]